MTLPFKDSHRIIFQSHSKVNQGPSELVWDIKAEVSLYEHLLPEIHSWVKIKDASFSINNRHH